MIISDKWSLKTKELHTCILEGSAGAIQIKRINSLPKGQKCA